MQNEEIEEIILKAREFFDYNKKKIIKESNLEEKVIYIDFMKLTEFSNKLSDEVLSNPEETLRLIELAIEESGLINNVRIRLKNLPISRKVRLRDIRSKHINEMIFCEGILETVSDIRPLAVNAKFECSSCGTIINVLQTDIKFKEPTRCSCGKKEGFRPISHELVDNQQLIIENPKETLNEKAQRITINLNEDLV